MKKGAVHVYFIREVRVQRCWHCSAPGKGKVSVSSAKSAATLNTNEIWHPSSLRSCRISSIVEMTLRWVEFCVNYSKQKLHIKNELNELNPFLPKKSSEQVPKTFSLTCVDLTLKANICPSHVNQ